MIKVLMKIRAHFDKKTVAVIVGTLCISLIIGSFIYINFRPTILTFLSERVHKPKIQKILDSEAQKLKVNLPFQPLADVTIASPKKFGVGCEYFETDFDDKVVYCIGSEYIFNDELKTDQESKNANALKAEKFNRYLLDNNWKRVENEDHIQYGLPEAISAFTKGDIIFTKKIDDVECEIVLTRFYGNDETRNYNSLIITISCKKRVVYP